ncbi:hypothetical protein K469DRAFT_761875 [Zopfia rhizophila CBS 207.26]|uniref:Uncharacterized protein n=1 Tax=Zopfia rhizophila CBS 207.26 TaxID=1314779 RepID=A0A6A6EHY0_9PEZI|nr:hypothetical protein K469DRAFT_761875 [Zopfia rhizophila CBS 207.26]
MYHQLQFVLRNTESEPSLIRELIKIGHGHKGARFKAYRRCLPLLAFACLHGLAIFAAGIFSSKAITSSDVVMIVSKSCGYMEERTNIFNISDDAIFETVNALLVMARTGYRKSAAYSRACYAQYGGNSTACGTYLRSTLSSIMSTVPCPFDQKICEGPGIALDTGFLRSDLDLGINTRPEDRISAKKVLTCAPLAGEKYTDGWLLLPAELADIVGWPPGTMWKGYKFGDSILEGDPAPDYSMQLYENFYKNGDMPYTFMAAWAYLNNNTESNFNPIPELQFKDSDILVLGLVNRMSYRNPVRDPWFNAQNCTNRTEGQLSSPVQRKCSSTNAVSFLGCKEQYQFCTADETQCSPYTGLYGITAEPDLSLNLNPTQKVVFQLFWKMMWGVQLLYQLGFIGRENLAANEYLWDNGFQFGISAELPDNQWQMEVANWMNTTLATMQRTALAYARPPEFDLGSGISSLKHIIPPQTPEAELLCHKIKARSKAHISFSVLGFFLNLGLGLLIITINLALPKTVAFIQKRTGVGIHKRLEWIESSGLQLQRMAAEGRGVGPWEGRDKDVPRLVEYGHVFSLTGSSLKGRWSRAESYGLGARGLKEDDGEEADEVERMEMLAWRKSPRPQNVSSDDRVRLLDR